jgi:hypothetical protein
MHSTPTRIVLAGSILFLGSLSTVSAVSLQSLPSSLSALPRQPVALTPPGAPKPGTEPPRALPAPPVEAPLAEPSSPSNQHDAHQPPVNAHDLVNMATAPLNHTVVAPVHKVEKKVGRLSEHVVRTVHLGHDRDGARLAEQIRAQVDRQVRRQLLNHATWTPTHLGSGDQFGQALRQQISKNIRRQLGASYVGRHRHEN